MATVSLSCPACDAHASSVVAELDDEKRERFIAYSNRKYNGLLTGWLNEIEPVVLRCEKCGHCWYKEQPSDHQLSLMYNAGNRLHPDVPMTRDPSPNMYYEMKRLRALVNQKTSSYLDYGSGFGRWARAAAQVGFDVSAFEPSQSRGTEENAPFTLVHDVNELHGKTFDVINLEQVLEHIVDPLEVLIGIRSFCNKESIVRVTVPNILRCDEAQNIWKEWPYNGKRPHIMAPYEHLHGFTPLSLNMLIRRAGYKTLPFGMLYRQYPLLPLRNVICRIYPAAGQTMLLMQPSHL